MYNKIKFTDVSYMRSDSWQAVYDIGFEEKPVIKGENQEKLFEI